MFLSCIGLLVGASALPLGAQVSASPLQPAKASSRVVQEPVLNLQEPGSAEGAIQAQEEPQGPSQLLQQMQQQQFRRTPDAVLQARIEFLLGDSEESAEEGAAGAEEAGVEEGTESDPAAAEAAEATEAARQVAEFRLLVMAGEWQEVGRFLREETGEDAAAIFQHLLQALVSQDQAILPGEVLEFAAICPGELDDSQLGQLGSLLQSAARRGSVGPIPDLIAAGHPQFGMADDNSRRRAAMLLFDAGLVAAAEPYLPEIAPDESDHVVLVQYARFHQHVGLAAVQRADRESHLQQAFDLYRRALQSPGADRAFRTQALGYVLALLPELPEGETATWRAALFTNGGHFGLSALARACQEARNQKRMSSRGGERVHVIGEIAAMGRILVSLATEESRESNRRSLNLVTAVLMEEAEFTLSADPDSYQFRRYDQTTRTYYPTYVAAEDLGLHMPDGGWLDLLDPGLSEKVYQTRIRLAAQGLAPDLALDLIRQARDRRLPLAQSLAEDFMSEWTRALEAQRVDGLDENRVSFNPGMNQGFGDAAPLTRAHQMRSLAKLADLLRAFADLGIESLEAEKLVDGFAACHSAAEVYRLEDIESLLGPVAQMSARMATALADNMRRNLGSRWQSQRVQEASGTRRNKSQVEEEVARGYALAEAVLQRALDLDADAWLAVLTRAALMFDFAEFTHARDPNLLDYTPLRDASFASFAEAADAYEGELVARRAVPTPLPYTLWFAASLGASELGFLTRGTQPDNDQVDLLRRAMADLGGEEEERHLALFANWANRVNVPAQVKPRFLRHVARVLGDHPEGEGVRNRLRLYEELIDEVRLVTEVDGSDQVGSGRPFGVRLSLRYTTALEREAGGFSKYLQNGVYTPGVPAPVDYLDNFEEKIRSTLFESFEVENLIFHQAEVVARPFGLHGWMEKPLAYLVLSARDQAVDRIPPLQIDMDFSDGKGLVVLPLITPVVLLDSDSAIAEDRPYEKLEAEMVLDARELADGKVRLEVRTRGRGVLPELERLLPEHDAVPGFVTTEIQPHGLNLVELDAESDPVMPLTERSWSLTLEPGADARGMDSFHFPALALDHEKLDYRRYADLDVVDAEAQTPLDSALLGGGGPPAWLVVLALAVLGGGAVLIYLRREPAAAAAPPRVPRPRRATPLATLAYLQRVEEDSGAYWNESTLAAHRLESAELERRCFSAAAETPPLTELQQVIDRWAERVQV